MEQNEGEAQEKLEEWGWGGGDKITCSTIWSFYVIYKGDKTFSREDKKVFFFKRSTIMSSGRPTEIFPTILKL